MKIKRHFLNAFALSGTAGRLDFFLYGILPALIFKLILLIVLLAIDALKIQLDPTLTAAVAMAGYCYFILLFLSMGAKRFRDIGKSPWFSLVLPIPIIGVVVTIALLAVRGSTAPAPTDT